MKKIITTVGTSLITNGLKNKRISQHYFNLLKNQPFSEHNNNTRIIKKIKNELDALIDTDDTNLSAEISSIIKITEQEPHEQFDVYLLATDTILSPLCAEYVKKWFEKHKKNIAIHFEYNNQHIVYDLSINDAAKFKKEGANNLFNILDSLLGEDIYSDYFTLNITGGYKGVIPYFTIFGQINKIKILYKFEDTDAIIEVPQLPINIDYSLFVTYFNVFRELDNIIEKDWNDYKIKNALPDVFDNYIEKVENFTSLNIIGRYFLNKISNYFLIDVNTSSSFFTENSGNKKQIINAVKELLGRLTELMNNNEGVNTHDSFHKYINDLGDKNDLRHGTNPGKNIYIFKSTNRSQVRLIYSFDFNNGFLKLKLYDYKVANFNHSTYMEEFKKKFSIKSEFEFISISIRKTTM